MWLEIRDALVGNTYLLGEEGVTSNYILMNNRANFNE